MIPIHLTRAGGLIGATEEYHKEKNRMRSWRSFIFGLMLGACVGMVLAALIIVGVAYFYTGPEIIEPAINGGYFA